MFCCSSFSFAQDKMKRLEDLLDTDSTISKIAFGSCCRESKPAPILDAVNGYDPNLWIWLGDNIYGDTMDLKKLEKKWEKQKNRKSYQKLLRNSIVIGAWDDHDYGKNDAGKELLIKKESQQLFLDFLDIRKKDPLRKQEGTFYSRVYGPKMKQIKIISLDTRYHRDELGTDGTILGEVQWHWLEKELLESNAQVNLIVSSIQLVPREHRFEKWANFPTELQRFYQLLAKEGIPPVTILSGDRHLAEISVEENDTPYPLYDITSSSLNIPIKKNQNEKNSRRIDDTENIDDVNFGTIDIDWSTSPPTLSVEIKGEKGNTLLETTIQQGS